MKSIKELYRIGTGPSSSHTMGPRKAAEMFLERHPDAASFKVTLYGSLAATGKGHMTDVAIIDTLQPTAPVEIVWQPKVFLPFHPNGMTFAALDNNDKVQENWLDDENPVRIEVLYNYTKLLSRIDLSYNPLN